MICSTISPSECGPVRDCAPAAALIKVNDSESSSLVHLLGVFFFKKKKEDQNLER